MRQRNIKDYTTPTRMIVTDNFDYLLYSWHPSNNHPMKEQEKHDESRRDFLKKLIAGGFTLATGLFMGSKIAKAGEVLSAMGACSTSYSCSGGSGKCGTSYSCSGQGAGGKGKCGSSYDCAGGGGKCSTSYACTGN